MTLAKAMIVASIAVLGNLGVVAAESAAADGVATAAVSHDGSAEGAIELAPSPRPVSDPCLYPEVAVVSSRPTWTGGAATIQCGVVQSDFGWLGQPVGGGTRQWMLPSSISYGLTPKLNLRWGLPGHIAQGGGNSLPLSGISDQSISALYRLEEQRPRMPALAFGYGVKIPSANPRKGFGTGFTDHQMVFVVSRDLGRSAHVDFNAVRTSAGGQRGRNAAAQFGVALSFSATKTVVLVLDSFGGSQPGISDRFGAELAGATWNLRPWLVFDAAYTRVYTAGSPREQFTVGFTHAMRPGFASYPTRSKFSRLLRR
jgi:hypothetical protein